MENKEGFLEKWKAEDGDEVLTGDIICTIDI